MLTNEKLEKHLSIFTHENMILKCLIRNINRRVGRNKEFNRATYWYEVVRWKNFKGRVSL